MTEPVAGGNQVAATKAKGQGGRFTLGIEEEFQLVDPETGELVPATDAVLEDLGEGARFQSELFQAIVETATPVLDDLDEGLEHVTALREALIEQAEAQGLCLAAMGTHPWGRYEDQDLTPSTRYDQLRQEVGWPFERSLVCGQHVHVGVGSMDQAVAAMNALRAFVPLLVALSVNAPYWRGLDTNMASVRLRIFDSMPRSGLQPRFDGPEDLQQTLDVLIGAGVMEDLSKVWWDVRPRPSLGTVEVRVCDMPTDVERSVALAGLIQAVTARAVRAHEEGHPLNLVHLDEVVAENRWRAMRHGTRARLIHVDEDGEPDVLAVPEAFELTRIMIEEEVEALGLERHMDRLGRLAARHEMEADRQREVYDATDELSAVVADVVERTPP